MKGKVWWRMTILLKLRLILFKVEFSNSYFQDGRWCNWSCWHLSSSSWNLDSLGWDLQECEVLEKSTTESFVEWKKCIRITCHLELMRSRSLFRAGIHPSIIVEKSKCVSLSIVKRSNHTFHQLLPRGIGRATRLSSKKSSQPTQVSRVGSCRTT